MSDRDNTMYERVIADNFKTKLRAILRTIDYHLYILQLENYELLRFWRLIFRRGIIPWHVVWRKKIIWTPKLVAVAVLAFMEYIAVLVIFGNTIPSLIIFLAAIMIVSPIFLSIAVLLLLPLDYSLKHLLLFRARRKLSQYPGLKIIAIAGSYGKTTVKEFIAAALKQKFNILITPENINTPVGIARLILKLLSPQIEIMVVEMGEYYRGDIKNLCALTPPDIAVVTGINEAHLERLRTMDNTAATIFEILDYSKPKAAAVLNSDDENIQNRYQPHIKGHSLIWYSYKNNAHNEFPTKLLGRYALGSVSAAVQVGRLLGVEEDDIKRGIASVEPIKHRLQPIPGAGGVLIIDDSYNGNPAGVSEAIRVLREFKDRRKIFLTPGLVEMGEQTQAIHRVIGQELGKTADLVILIKNSATPYIAEGLEVAGFVKTKIIWFNSALQAHAGLKDILRPNDVILFQNDWGDNYV